MISSKTKVKLDALFQEQALYRPAEAIAADLAQKSIIMFVGATCEGKNRIMDSLAKLDSRFHIAGTFTTRPPRTDDDASVYTYYPDTNKSLEQLIARIEAREVVQYAVNAHANLLYGSMPEDYSPGYNLRDVFSTAVEDFRNLGFKRAVAITVVTDPVVWLSRFEVRFPPGSPQRQVRRNEAIESFTWSLAQMGNNHHWVENIDGEPQIGAEAVIQIVDGAPADPTSARQLAEDSLRMAWSIGP